MGIPDRDEDESPRREPPPGLIIRARRPFDAEKIAELVNLPGYRFGTNRIPYHSPEEVRSWIEKATPGNLGLVAVVDDQIVGDGGLHRRSGRQLHLAEIGLGVRDAWTERASEPRCWRRWSRRPIAGSASGGCSSSFTSTTQQRSASTAGSASKWREPTAPLRCGTANTSTPMRWRASGLRASRRGLSRGLIVSRFSRLTGADGDRTLRQMALRGDAIELTVSSPRGIPN